MAVRVEVSEVFAVSAVAQSIKCLPANKSDLLSWSAPADSIHFQQLEFWSLDYCVVCQGTGWIWTEFHVDESSLRRNGGRE